MPRHSHPNQYETLHDFLDSYTVPMLKELASGLGANLPTRKAELVSLIQQRLETESSLRQIWESLDALQQAAVSEVLYSPSARFEALVFRAKYGRDPDWGEFDRWGQRKRSAPIQLLIYNGTLPRDLRERLKPFVPLPRPAEIQSADEPPATVTQSEYDYEAKRKQQVQIAVTRSDMEQAAQHDLHAVLRLIDTSKIQASDKTKQVTAAGARAITDVLQGGDFYAPEEGLDPWETNPWPIKAFAWPLLLQSAGLVELAGTRLQLTPAGKKALAARPHEVIHKLWSRWVKTTMLDEFNRVHTIKGQTGKGKRDMTSPASRRAVMVQALQMCPPQRWIAFDEFSRFMRANGNVFQVAHDLWRLYIEDPQYGSLGYSGFGGWHIVQGRYLLVLLFEYAATLGLIDVAYVHPSGARPDFHDLWGADDKDCLSRYDGLLSLRINSLGAWCLGLADAYVPAPFEVRSVLKVLPNRDIAVTEPIPPGDVLVLQQMAEQTSDFVWKIEPARVLESIEQGQSVVELVAFLEARMGGPLPETVAVFFQEVAEHAAQLADRGGARLIEAQDAALAHLITNDNRLRSTCLLAGERYIVVPDESERAFRRALRELGYALPASHK